MQSKEIICTVCPKGCKITIFKDQHSPNGYNIEGNVCKRGRNFAIVELTDPRRILTTTIKIKNGIHCRLPVRTLEPVPKGKIMECMHEINKLEISAPIRTGDTITENIASTGIKLVSSRNMDTITQNNVPRFFTQKEFPLFH